MIGVDKLGMLLGDKFEHLLVGLCFQLSEKEPDEFVRLVESQGKETERDGDVLKVRNKKFTCVIHLGESPAEQLSPLIFALIGPMWPLVFGETFDNAGMEIGRRIKENKEEALG